MAIELEERVDTLEGVLERYILHSDRMLRRMERDTESLKEAMARMERETRELKEYHKRSEREMNKRWGDLANKMGTLVEDIVAPSIPGVARDYFGCDTLDYMAVRVWKTTAEGRGREFDAIATCGGKFICNETKSTPKMDYVQAFVELVPHLPDYFPEARECEVIPIFASLYLPDSVVTYLSRKGIYAMAMAEDTMRLVNFGRSRTSRASS
jgi:hypothetical protein